MKLIKNNILREASESTEQANSNSTHRSNVNEYLFAHELGMLAGHGEGGKKSKNYNPRTGLETTPGYFPKDKAQAEKKFLESKSKLTKEEYEHQSQRAKMQALKAIDTYKRRTIENGGPLDLRKATHIAVSAGSGAIKNLTGHEDAESTENPSDVIARLPGKKGEPDIHAGMSLKSNMKDTENGGERISNRGLDGISNHLNLPKLKDMYKSGMEQFHGAHGIAHLPQDSDKAEIKPFTQKAVIRAGEKKSVFSKGKTIKDDAELVGSEMKTRTRDDIHDWINHHGSDPNNQLNVEMVRQHLLNHHFRAKGSSHPTLPFITVSGSGDGSTKNRYSAHGHFSEENSRVRLLQEATHITASPAGEYGMHVFAHTPKHPEGVHILKLDSKWNSQPMASAMKVVGTEGDPRKRKPEILADAEKRQKSAAARAAKKPIKLNNSFMYLTAAGRELFNEGYELSGDDAFQMLTLGTDMDDINLNENHKNYLKDSRGNVRIFMIRGAAAKEAHIKGGKVVPYSKGYAVLLEENQNDYHVFEKTIRSESGHNGGQETSSRSTILTESTERGSATGSGSERGETSETGEQSNAERKITFTFKELCERNFKNKNITEEKKVKQFSNDDTLNKAREIAANREKDVDDALDKATSLNQKAEYQLSRNKEALAGLKAIPKDSTVHFDPETGHWRGRDKNNNPVAGGPVTRNGMRNAANTMRAAQQRESINNGESGLSMASSGENMMRGSIRNKTLKKPLEELTGDETGASIGDQKEDELKKKGISLVSFKNRNFV